ncbi:phospholipase D/nuclease [Dendrothele bispora CBS 962.96]|uniref:Phospholipase D/nuclease n=1 Tax=Dendrothele bispora (strain CBS 962.96) TaxID=1314807 RepID=A0A4S8L6N9_DENBC|nr:phospholipase D/nuclease [Dendrothele bispora CBS 962.96]
MDSYEDDMARAIALSLQDQTSNVSNSSVNDLEDIGVDDEFDEQLRMAVEASKKDSTPTVAPPAPTIAKKPEATPERSHIDTTPATASFLSERAKLEKERLERQRQFRKARGLDENDDERKRKKSEEDDGEEEWEDEEDDKKMKEPDAKSSTSSRSATSARPAVNGNRVENEGLFWNGELRPTAVQGAEPREDKRPTIRLTQILGEKTDISFVILSTYALDLPWLYSLFDPAVPVILVTHPTDAGGQASLKNVLPNWIKTTPVLKGGFGVMHMKFMLIFYKTGRLRVAVTTANLVDFDWRDIENAAWVQDIQPLQVQLRTKFDPKNTESFQYIFKRVLDGVNVKPALDKMIMQGHPNLPLTNTSDLCTNWDWSRVKVALIPSIAGKYEGWNNVLGNGHPRLMKAIRNMGCRTGTIASPSSPRASSNVVSKKEKIKHLQVEYITSSTGVYTYSWLSEFYYSVRGESAGDWLDLGKVGKAKVWNGKASDNSSARTSRSKSGAVGKGKGKEKEKDAGGVTEGQISIVFPSKARVHASRYGERGAGTIFCQRKYWEMANYPRELFRESRSLAGNVLMHTKMIIGTLSDPPDESSKSKMRTKPTTATTTTTMSAKAKGKAKATSPDIIDLIDSDSDFDTPIPAKLTASKSKNLKPTQSRRGNGKPTQVTSETDSETESDTESESDSDGLELVDPPIGWVYVGSHNFTPSAWGTISGSGFNPVLNVKNYELGIVFPVRSQAEIDRIALFQRPLAKYKEGDVPWFQGESVYFK